MSAKILKEPIHTLDIGRELKEFMVVNGYPNLQSLVDLGTYRLQQTKGFTVICFESLMNILDRHGMLSLLEEGDE